MTFAPSRPPCFSAPLVLETDAENLTSLPERDDAETFECPIDRNQFQPFQARLGCQQSVERISMVSAEKPRTQAMARRDWNDFEIICADERVESLDERLRLGPFAEPKLRGQLKSRDRADEDLLGVAPDQL